MTQQSPTANHASSGDTVTLVDNATGKTFTLPVLAGSEGPRVIDIRSLYGETGYFTFDPGYTSTASCESKDRKSVV